MKIRKFRYFVGDFETTVFDGQEDTEVWASAVVEFNTEDVHIYHSIDDTFDYLANLAKKDNICIYYHNLKFDGEFWLYYLLAKKKWQQAYYEIKREGKEPITKWIDTKEMENKSFKYSISKEGQWYYIILKVNNHIIEIRDSLKLIPVSVKRIGESFGTKHKKLEMEYKGFRYAGCNITDEEKQYIANDVLVIKEALEIMFRQGHDKITIGSNCLSEYKFIQKTSFDFTEKFEEVFPNVSSIKIDKTVHGSENVDEWIRKSYHGGWCYVVKGKEGYIHENGLTYDVNSLYPSMMHSMSGNRYPYGLPHFWQGNFIPETAIGEDRYFFIRVKTRFEIKDGFLPTIQIKNDLLYDSTEWLTTSDWDDKRHKKYYRHTIDNNGNIIEARPEITFTMTDYKLFREHYNIYDFEILDGCWFYSRLRMFDEYIDKYKEIKQKSSGAIKEIAKLFLNNLYGKLSTSNDSSFKIAYIKDTGEIGYKTILEKEKETVYIPCGSAITSYARNFTIRTAQKNFYGSDKKGFIYADTDSIHCDLPKNKIKGITEHPSDFCCWKLETEWDYAIFTRQKTYMEHIIVKDGKLLQQRERYNSVKCAGMPDRSKELFNISLLGTADETGYFITIWDDEKKEFYKKHIDREWSDAEREFLFYDDEPIQRTYADFRIGLKVPDKLIPKRVRGGIILKDDWYTMRG